MAYSVYIERPLVTPLEPEDEEADPFEPIPESAWLEVVGADPSLRPVDTVELCNPKTGQVIEMSGPGMVEWSGHPEGHPVTFSYFRGRIRTGRPDDAVFAKLRALARQLGARVRGEGGEFYDAP